MATIHVLAGSGGNFRVVLHLNVPAGSNAAGVPYSQAAISAGVSGRSILPEGDGPAQITSAELAQVVAGTKFEVTRSLPATPGLSLATLQSQMATWLTNNQAGIEAAFQQALEYYGAVNA